MWLYEKRLLYPVSITRPNARMARLLLEQYAGGASELTAAVTYLNQRYTMPEGAVRAILTDIGTEELAHLEMVAGMITQCLAGLSQQDFKAAGMGGWYAAHRRSPFPADSSGVPWTAAYTVSSGDPAADIIADMAAEQQARTAYEGLISLSDDAAITDPLDFLRQREIVHYQRFGEALDIVRAS
ncbi:MAG: manganese catalase family protein [Eubacteriales bacterium]|nr:manganese catalase family protein [Eubacteriales bacterium]